MINENGNILITVILMMVILLSVAIGITSVSSGGLENSVMSGRDIAVSENTESIGEMVRNGTDWATGVDTWFQTLDIATNIYGRDRLLLKIFVDKRTKDIDINFPNLTSAGAIYITAIKGNLTGFNITMTASPAGASISADNISKDAKAYAKMVTPFQSGNYRFNINNPDDKEYVVFIRVFCKE